MRCEHLAKVWDLRCSRKVQVLENTHFSENSTRVTNTRDTQCEVVLMGAAPLGERKDATGEPEKGLYKEVPS